MLSFDPGGRGKTGATGWAYQDENELLDFGQLKGVEAVAHFLNDFTRPIDVVVCEDYIVFSDKFSSHVGSKVETIQVKGFIVGWFAIKGIKIHFYPSDVAPLAEKQNGLHPKGAHANTHWVYAANYGGLYLIQMKLKPSMVVRSMRK